ncbi:MAG TPA: alkaline phosphatase family protein, partial [Candidatus Cybelea sp.]|nr:alkaline phosphatase family protein [Candidatus Cybelea sp.]
MQTVFIILMENQNLSSFNTSTAPYEMGTLVPAGALATQYYDPPNSHPSEPNYVWLEAGGNEGLTTDNDPSVSNSTATTQHLATYLTQAGLSWREYAENITGTDCPLVSNENSLDSTSTSANYYARHLPFVFFQDLTDDESSTSATCIANIRPYSQLATDLANGTVARYNFITPNGTDDMHDSDIPTGDAWLAQNVPAILNSSAFKNNGVLIITFDEGIDSGSDGDGPIPMFVLSPLAKTNYTNSIFYDHSSTLLTLQEIFGVGPCLQNACTATDLSDLFLPGAIPPLPTEAGQSINFGALSNQTLGTGPFTLNATASSGLPVSFASTTPAVCAVSGTSMTLTAVGTCTIQATQPGNGTYLAATPVDQSFDVLEGSTGSQSQTITFGALPNEAMGSGPFTLSATASSGLAVSFASTTTSVCTVSAASVTLVAVGTCTIQATQAGNGTYVAATPVNQSFQVIPEGETVVELASGTSYTVPANWNSSNNTIEVIGGGGGGSYSPSSSIAAAGGGGGAYSKATNVTLTPGSTITYQVGAGGAGGTSGSPAGGTGGDTYFCNATTNCTSITGSAVVAGAKGGSGGPTSSASAPGGAASGGYPSSGVLYSGGASGAGNNGPNPDGGPGGGGAAGPNGPGGAGGSNESGTAGGGGGGGNGNGGAGQPPSADVGGGAGGWNNLGSGSGALGVGAANGGNGSYGGGGGGAGGGGAGGAPPYGGSGGNGGNGTEWDSAHGSGGGGGGGAGASANGAGGACGLYGGGAGGAGDDYSGNGPAGCQGIIVLTYMSSQGTQEQTITFGALSNEVLGTAPFTVSATASSGLAVSFASTTTSVCTVSGATVTLVAVGTCTIQATQAGNATYAAATPVNQSFQVTQGSQTITFGALSNEAMGTAPFTVSATASSGLAVSFASTTTSVCTVSGAT